MKINSKTMKYFIITALILIILSVALISCGSDSVTNPIVNPPVPEYRVDTVRFSVDSLRVTPWSEESIIHPISDTLIDSLHINYRLVVTNNMGIAKFHIYNSVMSDSIIKATPLSLPYTLDTTYSLFYGNRVLLRSSCDLRFHIITYDGYGGGTAHITFRDISCWYIRRVRIN